MDDKSGYIITPQNAQLVANISGRELRTIEANIGWVAFFRDQPAPRWFLVPRNAFETIKGFHYVDSPLNGLPARTVKQIRQEWAEVNKAYSEKLEELKKELERAKLREGGSYGNEADV